MRSAFETLAIALVLLVATTHWSVGAADSKTDWLPLNRSELAGILSRAAETNLPPLQTIEDYAAKRRAAKGSNVKRASRGDERLAAMKERLAPDTVWLLYGPELPFLAVLAGNSEQIHSLRVTVPIVNHSAEEQERTFAVLSELFAAIYPKVPEAARWPMESLGVAWKAHPLARERRSPTRMTCSPACLTAA